MPIISTTKGGRLAVAIRQARTLGCGVCVVKDHDGSVHAYADLDVAAGVLQITVAREEQEGP